MKRTRRSPPAKRVHDLRPLYAAMPGRPHLAALTIDEPGGLLSSDSATREQGLRRDGMLAHPRGETEWVPPARPTIIVAQSIRGDPLGQMFARHKLAPVRYAAGRAYQELHAITQIGRVKTTDPTCVYITGGKVEAELVSERQIQAARKLRFVDSAILKYLGTLGLYVTRTVLIDCKPLTVAGERTQTDKWTRGFLFSASLTMIAIKLGMATAALRDEDDEARREHELEGAKNGAKA